MEESFGWNFSIFNVCFSSLKLMIEHDENLYNFADTANCHCDKNFFDALTKEQFRCLIFISGLQTKLSLKTHPLKLMEKNPNVQRRR